MNVRSMTSRYAVLGLAVAGGLTLAAAPLAAQTPTTATSYLNPDTGKPTANDSVRSASSCESPDRSDTQAVGDPVAGKGNVHNDACLKDASGKAIDTQVTFESSGVGGLFACPDPDKTGPKTATKSDSDNDGLADRCTLSGYEAANQEYHTRAISAEAGRQTITFCGDEAGDGCANESVTDTVTITWAPAGGAATGVAPLRSGVPVALAAFAGLLVLAAGGATVSAAGRR